MLKGQTIFELTDVKSGEVERIVENNMFTNALNEVFNKAPFYFNNLLLSKVKYKDASENLMTPTFNKALGGLLLFPQAIEENAATIYAPTSNKPTGIASNDAYSGEDARRGSFNEIESGVITEGGVVTGYKFVWDFATSQANGSIACAALTSWKGGKGYLDGEDVLLHSQQYDTSYAIGGIFHTNGASATQADSDAAPRGFAIGADAKGVYFYRPDKKTVCRYAAPQNALDLMFNSDEYETLFTVATEGSLCVASDGVYVIRNSANSSGSATINIDKFIEANNWAKTTQTISAACQCAASNKMNTAALVNGNLYVKGYQSLKVNRINLSNLADVEEFAVSGDSTRIYAFGNMAASNKYLIESDGTVHAVDLSSHPMYKAGAWALLASTQASNYQLVFGASVFTPYLATINNLQNVVTKTADKTMKVSYIVSIA